MTKKERKVKRLQQADQVVGSLEHDLANGVAAGEDQELAHVHLTIGGKRLFVATIMAALAEAECRGLEEAIGILKS